MTYYIYSEKLVEQLDKVVKVQGRAQLVHSLIDAYNLLPKLKVVSGLRADEKAMLTFHSQAYIDFLKRCSLTTDADELDELLAAEGDEFGIGYDCPPVDNVYELCEHVAGASLTAAHLINTERARHVVNWFGGWHHGRRDRASGFCYCNDIVLCINKLRQKFDRVLYLDLDLHHGDAVQEAFEFTNKVMTVSFHKHQPGFFPGTGAVDEIGKGAGKYYNVNVPLSGGVDDATYIRLFLKIFDSVLDAYKPQVIVVQCGADSLYGDPIDPHNPFNITLDGYLHCIRHINGANLPTIFLGGGGYHLANSARLWCSIVATVITSNKNDKMTSNEENVEKLSNDIPEHEHFLAYGPDYELVTSAGGNGARNHNSLEKINQLLARIIEHISHVKPIT